MWTFNYQITSNNFKHKYSANLDGFLKLKHNQLNMIWGFKHLQPSDGPVQTDNSIAEKVINKKVQPKRTKAMDMRFHWLRDRECQQQFRFYWRPGKLNYADYWTKHHPSKHHHNVRRNYLTPMVAIEMFRQEERRRKELDAQPTWRIRARRENNQIRQRPNESHLGPLPRGCDDPGHDHDQE